MDGLSRERFEDLVRQALADLPDEFAARLENVDLVLEDEASVEQLRRNGLQDRPPW